jgi:hypothetical protein
MLSTAFTAGVEVIDLRLTLGGTGGRERGKGGKGDCWEKGTGRGIPMRQWKDFCNGKTSPRLELSESAVSNELLLVDGCTLFGSIIRGFPCFVCLQFQKGESLIVHCSVIFKGLRR